MKQYHITTKYCFTFFCLILALTSCSCGNGKRSNSQMFDTTTSQAVSKKETEGKSTLLIGGKYSFGKDAEKDAVGSILVYPLTNHSALFFLDVCRGAPSYNLGQLFGQMTIKDNVGRYTQKDNEYVDCVLTFEFGKDQLRVTTKKGHADCGFGNAVYADNIYKLIEKSTPTYFIDGHGDTTLFEGLTVEKYEHRFD